MFLSPEDLLVHLAVLAAGLAAGLLTTIAQAAVSPAVQIGPTPLADRRFPYVQEGVAFEGTFLRNAQTRLSAPVLSYPAGEAEWAARLGDVAFALGQLSEAPAEAGPGRPEHFRPLVVADSQLSPATLRAQPVIWAGPRDRLPAALRAKLHAEVLAAGPAVWVVPGGLHPAQPTMVLTGPNRAAVEQAIGYLAHEGLYRKSGAYDGLFSFVRLRGYLEHENYLAAIQLLDDPRGVAGCAKPVDLARRKPPMPPAAQAMAARRNELVFKELRAALQAQDKAAAVTTWKAAMGTCFACHQGAGIPQVRKFKPLEYPHRAHQAIAAKAGLTCAACHEGPTAIRGY